MKNLALLLVLLYSNMAFAIQDTTPIQPPQPQRWERPGSQTFEVAKSLMERVISHNPRVVNNYPNLLTDFKECQMMRVEYVAQCIVERGSAIIDAAMAQPQVQQCVGTVLKAGRTLLWTGTGEYVGSINDHDTFVLLRREKVKFLLASPTSLDGYYVRMTSGESSGQVGYIAEVYAHLNCQ